MKVLIVDDEPLARERMAQILRDKSGAEVVGSAENGRQAIDQVREHKPDVVLMDIKMPVMDGLEAAHHLKKLEHPPAVIFCTAYDAHALEAFEARAVDYLVKPVRSDRLQEALDRVNGGADLGEAPDPEQRSHLCARMRGNLELVPLEEVIYFQAEHKYVTVVHEKGEVLIEEPLKALEEEFGDQFLRIHRNALVALDRITGLEKTPDGRTVINLEGTDSKPEISRRSLPGVRKTIRAL